MPANRFNGYSDLGIGIGLRIPHYAHILTNQPGIDWFEIISENFMVGGGRPLEILDAVLERYPVIQHGVSLYFGSLDPFDKSQLESLKRLTLRTKTPFVSDHLCWGSFGGAVSHDLLPLPYTKEAVNNTADRIRYVQDFLSLPVAVENVSSYLEYTDSTMTEWQFLSAVAEKADCGILLDVNNVFVSSRNHDFDPYAYLDNIPLQRTAQIHLAGHSERDGYLLDTHDNFVKEEVWQLYRHVVGIIGPTNTLLEWDAHIPDFDVVHNEARKAKAIITEAFTTASTDS
ncbi:MAG: DUF692 domain-containing protein [Candidatus Obscuribacterales bacterium]|nr:DUF692 domain-containing protein [Candidatus Obscuribacterales bacterium]